MAVQCTRLPIEALCNPVALETVRVLAVLTRTCPARPVRLSDNGPIARRITLAR